MMTMADQKGQYRPETINLQAALFSLLKVLVLPESLFAIVFNLGIARAVV